ncbi:Helicase PriA essential for oriC/DnaA-independent DNA replication [Marinilactibacillus psychrotolerans 42ea]|uniref:Replication restart protein PriA n=1 Tax=Marinilactibacillus psychrotolerans 42ea TaxID=1255609 RepID=A0A1R4JRW2_9LACT|nr:primosomal protein N' [Marinilactibacillus psychrotolerans]SJN35001.1 Helicase PriA essential for oriC/DnaA-independent DNA replication [Marinilactibacillus psychrotolerans 42ea]
MPHIAEVIVDVPVLQTNKPFHYEIPKEFEQRLVSGMRVVVPFGNGSRLVQGFVINRFETSDYNGELKKIDQLMDLMPVLNKELIDLGEFMAKETFSFRISCYQTMLPAVLRAKYEKKISLIDDLEEETLFEVFRGKQELTWEEVIDRDLVKLMLELKAQGKVEVNYEVKDKRTKKTIKKVTSKLNFEQLEEISEGLRANAKRQIDLINVLQSIDSGEWLDVKWLTEEYGITLSTLKAAENKGWCQLKDVEIYRDPFKNVKIETTIALMLNPAQQTAYNEISNKMAENIHEVFLLKGITGSGKTEVYLQTISKVLDENQGALMLVPEIALTPQMVYRFKSRFGEKVAVLHSGLSEGEKYDEWRKINNGEASVVVGARSSVFAPLKKIGLIIIDEEHETSYKQEENPRYHARDIAIWRGAYHHCPVILGSATPSLESSARASKGVYTLLELKERANKKALPEVSVIDMREEAKKGNRSNFSLSLQGAIKERLEKKEQSVLMLNRRGYSSFVMCRDCGFVLGCPNCDISQTLHMDTKTMKCHYCGHEEGIPAICPNCQSKSIRYFGTGTQKVQEELQGLFPEARIIRMDVDTTRRKGAHERLLKDFGDKKADILLGTQMIAKGLDFPDVTLVGVINADTSLGLPDFRSAERTFQLLTQVSGRAGRAEKIGKVYVQSFNPEHYAIQYAKKHDYDSFYKREMHLRHLSDYSPYYFLVRISVSHENEMTAAKKIGEFIQFIRPVLSDKAIVLGPTPKSIARTHNRYHFQVIIKYKKEEALSNRLHELLARTQKDQAKGLFISIDSQPMNFI